MSSRPAGVWTRAEIYFVGNDTKEWSNIFWWKPGAATPVTDRVPDALTIITTLAGNFAPLQSATVKSIGGVVEFNDGTGTYGVDIYQDQVGSLMADPIPEDVSAVVQRLTATSGPSGRGRIFISGVDSSLAAGSYLSTAGVTAVAAFATNMGMPIGGATQMYAPYFFSATTSAFLAVMKWYPVNLLATARRRRPRF